MSTENQSDFKKDTPSYDGTGMDFQPRVESISQLPAYRPVLKYQLDGYWHPSGYQAVTGSSGNKQLSIAPVLTPNTVQTEDPSKGIHEVIVTQPGQTHFVVVQQQRPADYIPQSLLACICCFWPTGLVAIYFACMANSLADKGQMKDARIMAKCSRNFIIISVILGIAVGVLYILYANGMLWKNGYNLS